MAQRNMLVRREGEFLNLQVPPSEEGVEKKPCSNEALEVEKSLSLKVVSKRDRV